MTAIREDGTGPGYVDQARKCQVTETVEPVSDRRDTPRPQGLSPTIRSQNPPVLVKVIGTRPRFGGGVVRA